MSRGHHKRKITRNKCNLESMSLFLLVASCSHISVFILYLMCMTETDFQIFCVQFQEYIHLSISKMISVAPVLWFMFLSFLSNNTAIYTCSLTNNNSSFKLYTIKCLLSSYNRFLLMFLYLLLSLYSVFVYLILFITIMFTFYLSSEVLQWTRLVTVVGKSIVLTISLQI